MRRGLRFRPPDRALPSGIDWVLARAFGPAPASAPATAPPAALLGLAQQVGLAARIGGRTEARRLHEELQRDTALEFLVASLEAQRQGEALRAACDSIEAALRRSAISVVPLKGIALFRSGYVRAALRPMSDADLLVPGTRILDASAVLAGLGFVPGAGRGGVAAHQLAPARDPAGRAVELHLTIPGILAGSRFVGFDDLRLRGLIDPFEGGWLPSRELLVAHALVHGIAQHGFAPRSYPLLQMMADVVDLGAATDADLMGRGHALIARDVSAREVEAVRRLAVALERGQVVVHGDEGTMLRHFVHGSLDPGYARTARLRTVLDPLSASPRILAVAREAAAHLWLDRERSERVYGRRGRVAGTILRALRPLDGMRRGLALWFRSRRARRS